MVEKRPDLQTAIPMDLVIGLERTACPCACPDYSLFVYSDGKIVYEGRHYVAIKGIREGHISKAQVRQLFNEFWKIGYFSLKDRYDPIAKDGVVTKTSIRADGRKKEIVNCHPSQAPENLYLLEKMIDEIARSERWTRHRSGQPALKP
jgi:hypothetical protein